MSDPQEPNPDLVEKPPGPAAVEGFSAQYETTYPRLTMIAAAMLGRWEGAEDIVQQAAGIAIAQGKQFSNTSACVAWMVGAVRRCALNQRRKFQRRRTYATDPADMSGMVAKSSSARSPIDATSGELLANQTSFEDQLLRALQTLSDEARCCLLLRTVQELSYAEIAELLDIPAGTAMSHVHRSRQMLRKRLAQWEESRGSNHASQT